jgi:hypothetical protein
MDAYDRLAPPVSEPCWWTTYQRSRTCGKHLLDPGPALERREHEPLRLPRHFCRAPAHRTGASHHGHSLAAAVWDPARPARTDRQREAFDEAHLKRCDRKPEPVGSYADVVADVWSLPACPDSKTAYSVARGAAHRRDAGARHAPRRPPDPESCPSVCQTSCIDCLQTLRNAFYHKQIIPSVPTGTFAPGLDAYP